ncbi:metallophosphoesterase [Alloalcanivorax marinus]|uniref:metallophosphoesterase n=1 Tax=Alloalcanivorax marinus TaxID=1177169 RepID=UPI001931CB94|nr:metallophosphoesterase [Alloalcanivorax marinus]MBL7251593.1 metallophosphoesterase [Alloalcanivorax marinus]
MSLKRRDFIRNLLIGGASVPVLSACGGGGGGGGDDQGATPGGGEETGNTPDTPEAPRTLRFIAVGDTGSGGQGQYQVAAAMEAVVAERGCDLVLLTGDNIYEAGVTAVDDPQFLEKFEYPYQNLDLPFFLCLGNHDCASTVFGGGSDNQRGDYQVMYHYSRDRYSNKWHMPARFYSQAFDTSRETPFLELFVVDSNPLTSFYLDHDENFNWSNYGYPQQTWMKRAVGKSQAHWKIAMTHVPYRSNGKHGNAGDLDAHLRWMFNNPDADGLRYKAFLEECFADRADLLLTGHDHSLQWLQPAQAMGRTELIVSGAGAKTDDFKDANRNPVRYQNDSDYGFVWVELNEDSMTTVFYQVSPDDGSVRIGHQETRAKPVTADVLEPA